MTIPTDYYYQDTEPLCQTRVRRKGLQPARHVKDPLRKISFLKIQNIYIYICICVYIYIYIFESPILEDAALNRIG